MSAAGAGDVGTPHAGADGDGDVMVKVDGVLWHSPLRQPLPLGAPPKLRHRYRYRHRHCVLRRSWVLLGQGMRVLHMLVRTVMVMVMVKVDGVLWHSR